MISQMLSVRCAVLAGFVSVGLIRAQEEVMVVRPIATQPAVSESAVPTMTPESAVPTVAVQTQVAAPMPSVERGQPNGFIDCVGWIIGIPSKIILWDCRVNKHSVSADTEAKLTTFAAANGLQDTKIRLNQYSPGDEWRRLCANKRVGCGWRYTVGALHCVGYTILPGRIFGRDKYNPYTNSIYVYSDAPAMSIVEAAYAADVRSRDLPGTYAFTQEFPIASLWHETIATRRVLAYEKAYGTTGDNREADHLLYPRYGSRLGSSAGVFFVYSLPFEVAGAAAGHVVGRFKSSRLPADEPAVMTAAKKTPTQTVTPVSWQRPTVGANSPTAVKAAK